VSLPQYPEYKDSGHPHISKVPSQWEIKPLKHCLRLITEKAAGKSSPIALENIEGWSARYLPSESDFEGVGIAFRQGDILFGKLRPYLAKVYQAEFAGEAIGDFHVMRPVAGLIGRYALYQFLQESFISVVDGATHGAKMPRVGWEFMGNMPFVVPRPEEQLQIARFLSHETAKIDALIREQERLIELLQEKRQAVISHAVTKGLDPDVPMKDSGVEWLEEVPAHWRVVPFGYAISYQEGPGIMASDFRDEGVPLLRVSGVQGRWASLKGCNYLDPKKVKKRWKHFQLNHGDLLISASASMGTVCEVDNATVGAVPYTGLIRLTPIAKISHRDFVRAIVGSQQFAVQIDLFKAGSTIQHFGPTHLSQMKVALPPLEEQIQLAEHVDKVTTEFKSLIEEAETGNKLLKERRTALISAAVTGKIDVRNWQPPQDESAFDEEVRKAGMEATA